MFEKVKTEQGLSGKKEKVCVNQLRPIPSLVSVVLALK